MLPDMAKVNLVSLKYSGVIATPKITPLGPSSFDEAAKYFGFVLQPCDYRRRALPLLALAQRELAGKMTTNIVLETSMVSHVMLANALSH